MLLEKTTENLKRKLSQGNEVTKRKDYPAKVFLTNLNIRNARLM
jgi:hypothetical protein